MKFQWRISTPALSMSIINIKCNSKNCLPEVVRDPGLQDLGGPEAGGGKQGDDPGHHVAAPAVGAVPRGAVTEGCDHPLEQGTDLQVVCRVFPVGQQDEDLVPVVRGPTGLHVWRYPHPDDPTSPIRPGTVVEVWVVPLRRLSLQAQED